MLLAIHFARSGLLGHSPIPCPSQKFLLRLRVLQTLFPALAVYPMYGARAGLVRKTKIKRAAVFCAKTTTLSQCILLYAVIAVSPIADRPFTVLICCPPAARYVKSVQDMCCEIQSTYLLRFIIPILYLPPSFIIIEMPKGKHGGVMQVWTD